MGQSVARHPGVAATIRRLGDPMTNLRGGRPHPKGHPPELVNRMYDAWMKSMILQATLWIQPYIREGDY